MNTDHDLQCKESRLAYVSEKVAAVIGNYSLHLGDKRERLQNVIFGESESYNEELERQKQMQAEAYFEERKNRALSSVAQLEAKRKDLAERLMDLYLKQNSEELKINESMQKCWEAADYNKLRMEEMSKVKSTMHQLNLTLDGLLHQFNLKQVIGDEDTIAQRRMENTLHSCAISKNQIIEKRLKIEEKIMEDVEDYEHLKKSAKDYEEEEKQECLRKWQEKQQLAKEKYENLIYSIAKRKEKELFDKELSKYYCQTHLINNVERPSCSKEQLRLEQELFLETQRKIKEEMRRAEALENELRQLENCRQEEKEIKAKLLDELKKRKQYQDVLQTQIMQIMATTKLGNS